MNRTENDLLSHVGSDAGKLVIIYLLEAGTATVEQIASRFDWTTSKAISICSSLEEDEIVTPLEHSSQLRYALKRVVR